MGYRITVGEVTKEYDVDARIIDVARDFQKDYDLPIVMSVYNNCLKELNQSLKEDGELQFLTVKDKNGRLAYRRSVIFMLQEAIFKHFDEVEYDLRVYRSISGGFFCRVSKSNSEEFVNLSQENLTAIEAVMKQMVEEDLSFEKMVLKTNAAKELFRELHMFKKEKLLRYRTSSNLNVYKLGDSYDYFYGYMVPSTGYLTEFRLEMFGDGFVVLFPNSKSGKVEEFKPSMKLCTEFKRANVWANTIGIQTVGDLNETIVNHEGREVIFMQEALMEQEIGRIADDIYKDGNKKFIMIAGPSSSGKTTFSHRLTTQLKGRGLKPHPIALDNYYLDRELVPVDEFGEKDFECIEGLDIEQFNEDMLNLLNGKKVCLPKFNFKTGKREYDDKYLQLGPEDVLVIEGIHGLNDRMSHSLPKESKYKIFISALTQLAIDEHNPLSTSDARLLRRIVRDARTRGTDARGSLSMWASVRRGEEKNIFPFQEEADVMINSAAIYELSVLKVYALPLLYAVPADCPEYTEANRLIKLLDYFIPMPSEDIPRSALIREFIGNSCYHV